MNRLGPSCLRALVLVAASACAPPAKTSDIPGWAPVAGISRIPLGDTWLTYAGALEEPRARLEPGLPPPVEQDGSAWIGYGPHLRIEYEDGVAVRLKARTPQQFRCAEAARWMGFPLPRRPIIDGPRCIWPGVHLSQRLEKGFGGEYDRSTQWFWIWLVPSTTA